MLGISTYEDLLLTDGGTFKVDWPSDLVTHNADGIYEDMNFAIEIERKNPDTGEAPLNTDQFLKGKYNKFSTPKSMGM